ncbi:MAG: formate dehydrogenase accessory sulfurtransferase FdhD [Betaproteobacteria bacterium]
MQRDLAPDNVPDFPEPVITHQVERWADGKASAHEDQLAQETPVALVYNGISHAVMLASPSDLVEFATGFTLSEGIAEAADEIYDIEVMATAEGIEVHIGLSARRMTALKERRRNLSGRTGCGLCGTESLAEVQRTHAQLPAVSGFSAQNIHRAMQSLAAGQRMHALTGAVHAAAWATRDGTVEHVFEDVGRHNALDKLIGCLAREKKSFSEGCALITSRASFEMVQKCLVLGIPLLGAVSAPTSLAVKMAQEGGLTLLGFVRKGQHVVYADPHHLLSPVSA